MTDSFTDIEKLEASLREAADQLRANSRPTSKRLLHASARRDLPALDVPASWPPELYDADAVRYSFQWLLDHPADADWRFYYKAGFELAGTGYDPHAAKGEHVVRYTLSREQRKGSWSSR